MLPFFFQQIIFYSTIVLVLFVPGYFLLRAIQGKTKIFTKLELPLFSFALSIITVDFLMLVMDKIRLPITRLSLLAVIAFFGGLSWAVFKIRSKKQSLDAGRSEVVFSPKQNLIALSLVFVTILIKTIYLSGAILPSATDLGHHMYWANAIVQDGTVPVYEKADITPANTLETGPIADFIVGEHLVFAAVALISGQSVVSAFPVLILFLIHLAALYALFVLTLELFRSSTQRQDIALLVLFFAGPLYAIASPQMKFVSGGVIGNTIGNLLIPLTLYLLLRALKEKNSALLALALFAALGLAYTHHLSTFVFIFIVFFAALCFLATNLDRKTLWQKIQDWKKLFLNPAVFALLAFGAVLVFFVYTPTYLNVKAVDTAVGTPSKATRTGFTLGELTQTVGEVRMALGMLGIALLALSARRKKYSAAILLGWAGALLIMSLAPQLLFIDIPSNRIASYSVFPFAILSAYALATGIAQFKKGREGNLLLNPVFFICLFFLLVAFSLQSGQHDNAGFVDYSNNAQNVVQTYRSAAYLAEKTTSQDIVIKDHNYLAADSWIKLAFMRGYTYPLSRGYFKRYEDATKQREQCTYHMITTPSNPAARECFQGTGTDFVMVAPQFDSAQFRKDPDFSQVYISDAVGIYYRQNK